MGRFIKSSATTTLKDESTGSIHLPAGSTAERPADPIEGNIRYNTESSQLEFFNGSNFEDVSIQGSVTITKDSFVGDGSTVVYTMSINPNDENGILVFVGNVHQNPGVAYTVSGSTITFSSAPPDTHTIVILHGFNSTIV